MPLRKKHMKYEDLKEGDLIRALITDEKLSKNKREHCFIIFNEHRAKDETKKRHRICIPACSFSSKFPKCDDETYIEIDTDLIPPNLFNEQKENTILRVGKPKCVERYQFKEYKTNLKSYPEFWKELCEKVNGAFPEDLGDFDSVCDCQCLVDNEIEAGYCEQDECFLVEEICKEETQPKKLCSCCGFKFPQFDHKFTICPNCNDNVYIIIIDNNGCECFIHNPEHTCQ